MANSTFEWFSGVPDSGGLWAQVYLMAEIGRDTFRFSASPDGIESRQVGPVLDFTPISYDHANGFTGTMVGIAAQDLVDREMAADSDYFELKNHG